MLADLLRRLKSATSQSGVPAHDGQATEFGELPEAVRRARLTIERSIGVSITTHEIFMQALRHRSARDTLDLEKHETYERVEFLGDAVVGLIVADLLYSKYPEQSEGFLTKLRSRIVKRDTLAMLATNTGLHEAMEIGERSHGKGIESSRSVLSDIFEAFMGAIYLQYGFEEASRILGAIIRKHLDVEHLSNRPDNYKSQLLEYCQERKLSNPHYQVIEESGPPHDRMFRIRVHIDGRALGEGDGKSKKQAEQQAAKQALKQLE